MERHNGPFTSGRGRVLDAWRGGSRAGAVRGNARARLRGELVALGAAAQLKV